METLLKLANEVISNIEKANVNVLSKSEPILEKLLEDVDTLRINIEVESDDIKFPLSVIAINAGEQGDETMLLADIVIPANTESMCLTLNEVSMMVLALNPEIAKGIINDTVVVCNDKIVKSDDGGLDILEMSFKELMK